MYLWTPVEQRWRNKDYIYIKGVKVNHISALMISTCLSMMNE